VKILLLASLMLFQVRNVYQQNNPKMLASDYVGIYSLDSKLHEEFPSLLQFNIIEGKSENKFSNLKFRIMFWEDSIRIIGAPSKMCYCKSFSISKDSLCFDTKSFSKARYVFKGAFISPPRRTPETTPPVKGVLEYYIGSRLKKRINVQFTYSPGC